MHGHCNASRSHYIAARSVNAHAQLAVTSQIGTLVGKALSVTGGVIAIHTNLQLLVEMISCVLCQRKDAFRRGIVRAGLELMLYNSMRIPVKVPSQE